MQGWEDLFGSSGQELTNKNGVTAWSPSNIGVVAGDAIAGSERAPNDRVESRSAARLNAGRRAARRGGPTNRAFVEIAADPQSRMRQCVAL